MATQKRRSFWALALCFGLILAISLTWGYKNPTANTSADPLIDREKTVLKPGKKQLVIVGENFESSMAIELANKKGILTKGQANFQNSNTIIISGVGKSDFPDGVATIKLRNSKGVEIREQVAVIPSAIGPSPLTEADIRQIIGQGVAQAQKLGFAGTFTVVDREGNILAIYQMKGASKTVVVRDLGKQGTPSDPQGLEGVGGTIFPGAIPAIAATISKAGTGAFLSTFGNAFTTRTAAFIIREHIPPFITNMPSGPLFGVQVSSLGCSDIKQPGLPLGMSGDTGGVPIYKNGVPSGGLGVELNGEYNVALNRPVDLGRPVTPNDELFFREGIEELTAFAAVRGFEPPDAITADKLLVNGLRLQYRRSFDVPVVNAVSLNGIGSFLAIPPLSTNPADVRIRTNVPSEFRDIILRDRPVRVVPRFFPFKNGTSLTVSDVEQVLFQAVREANRVRAAIRRPIDVPAEVNISCIDVNGQPLGVVSTPDAPVFGFDVSAEKARAAILFSRSDADRLLNAAGSGKYARNLLAEGLRMDGSFAFAARSVGFIHRPFFPDDIDGAPPGPLSTSIDVFSPLNNGFQTDFLLQGANRNPNYQVGGKDLSFIIGRSIVNVLAGKDTDTNFKKANFFCDASNGKSGTGVFNSTVMIFSGSSPLYKSGKLAGAVGISGDGIDQDDIIGSYGSENFEANPEIRIDRFFMRGIRIPFTKFPRHPHIGEE